MFDLKLNQSLLKYGISAFFVLFSAVSSAGLVESFKQIEQQRKGPFTLNYLQGSRSRAVVGQGSPAGQFQFQAAFRNDLAKDLALKQGVYLGNLFATNYYELMGEFVYGDPNGSHGLEHETLVAMGGPTALAKANQMVQNWILEKYYVSRLPESKLAASFQLRGISGAEFEQEYAKFFFNFYLSTLKESDQFYFLPAYLLLKESPVGSSSQLDVARQLVSTSYDYFLGRWGGSDPRVKDLYELRNAIHNQLSRGIINLIDQYVKKHSFYKAEGHTYLFKVKAILQEYYNFKSEKVAALAKKLGQTQIAEAANNAKSSDPQSLVLLSDTLTSFRDSLVGEGGLSWKSKSEGLLLIAYGAQYLAKEVSESSAWNSNFTLVLVNVAYLEGFLIQDNWNYFREEAKGAAAGREKELLSDLIVISGDTLDGAFSSTLPLWRQLSAKFDNFKDDQMKSSVLGVIAQWASKL